jgi:ElaB/YqjD/DUF883 family membrane-anchored ribosome-binding protein
MTQAYKLQLRCFLEGIEVPIAALNLNIQPNNPAQFQVQIPATDRAFDFKARTLVHVFFYDFLGAPTTSSLTGVSDVQVEPVEDVLEQATTAVQEGAVNRADTVLQAAISRGRQNALIQGSGAQRVETAEEEAAASTDTRGQTIPNEGAAEGAAPSAIESPWLTRDEIGRTQDNPFTQEDDRWRFLIGGEIIGFEYVRGASQRAIVLNCLDWSVYWDTCYQYQVNIGSIMGDGYAAFVGAGTTFRDHWLQGDMAPIVRCLRSTSITQPWLQGLLAGIVRLLEAVGGVYIGNEPRGIMGMNPANVRDRFKGVNDFFSIAELRLKLVYMISAAESDDSSRRQVAREAFSFWGRRYANRLGRIASFREILNVVMQYIFHSVFAIPAPMYVAPSERRIESTRTSRTAYAESPAGQALLAELSRISAVAHSLSSTVGDPGTLTAEALRNRIYSVMSGSRDQVPRASGVGSQSAASALREAASAMAPLHPLYTAGADPAAVYRNNSTTIESGLNTAMTAIDRAWGIIDTGSSSDTTTTSRFMNSGGRLNFQIVRPDIFMVSVPRCNVIFPEMISNLHYRREFLREVTRMRLTVSDEIFGSNQLLDNLYYAPDLEVIGAFDRRGRRGRNSRLYGQASEYQDVRGQNFSAAVFSKRLMDHEFYTGVVPVFERMNEITIYAARTDQVSYRGTRVPFVIRCINHQFFKSRWQPRALQLECRFNPYIVPGFPALVMDRYMTKHQVLRSFTPVEVVERGSGDPMRSSTESESSSTNEHPDTDAARTSDESWAQLHAYVPRELLGLIEGMSHSISQGSAATMLMLTHARIHDESEELLNSNVKTVNRTVMQNRNRRARTTRGTPGGRRSDATSDGRAIRSTVVAALETPEIGSVGMYYGEITAVAESSETGEKPLFGTHTSTETNPTWLTVPVGVTQRAMDFGAAADQVITMVGSPSQNVTFRAYRITEAIDRWVGQEVAVPLEDFIRPPWMADCWKNDRIGAVYQQFFGTGSITDPSVIDVGDAFTSIASVDETSSQHHEDEQARIGNVSDPGVPSGQARQTSSMDINIERAVDLLVRTYSAIRHHGLSVDDFEQAYTWRPIATLTDMLGSRDLRINVMGDCVGGREGLHSRAFGHGDNGRNLRNLVNDNVGRILDIDVDDNRGALERMDKRADKAEIVQAYVEELWENRGLLG